MGRRAQWLHCVRVQLVSSAFLFQFVHFSPLDPVHLISPLQLSQFKAELHDYPDRTAATYVLTGLREGFHIGFEAVSVSLQSASSNLRSALDHPSVINAYLDKEVSCGRVTGPFTTPSFPDLQPFGGYSEEQPAWPIAFNP